MSGSRDEENKKLRDELQKLLGNQQEDASELLNPGYYAKKAAEIARSNIDPKTIVNELAAMDSRAQSIAKSFGYGKEEFLNIKQSIIEARDGVFSLGGKWEDIISNQKDASNAVGRNITLTAESQKQLFAMTQTLDLKVGETVSKFKDVGVSALEVGDQMTKIINRSREAGVSASAVAKQVTENLGMLNQYNFKDGVDGLARMAAQATAMRINVKDMQGAMEAAFEPETAIKMAAELQRLGVTQSALLDPLSLMNMAENDPEELMKQIGEMSKQFGHMTAEGKVELFKGAPRIMRQIEKTLKMAPGQMSKLTMSTIEAEEKLKRITFPPFATDEQRKLITQLTEMKDGKIFLDGKPIEETFSKFASPKELGEYLKSKTDKKTVEQLAEDQLTVLDDIRNGINVLAGKVPAAFAGTKTGEKIVRGYASGAKEYLGKANEMMGGNTGDLSKKMRATIDPAIENLGKVNWKNMHESLSKLGPEIDKFVKGLELNNLTKKAKEKLEEGEQYMDETTFKEMMDGLSSKIPDFKDQMTDYLKNLGKQQKDFLITKNGEFFSFAADTFLAGTASDETEKKLAQGKPLNESTSKMDFSDISNTLATAMSVGGKKPETSNVSFEQIVSSFVDKVKAIPMSPENTQVNLESLANKTRMNETETSKPIENKMVVEFKFTSDNPSFTKTDLERALKSDIGIINTIEQGMEKMNSSNNLIKEYKK